MALTRHQGQRPIQANKAKTLIVLTEQQSSLLEIWQFIRPIENKAHTQNVILLTRLNDSEGTYDQALLPHERLRIWRLNQQQVPARWLNWRIHPRYIFFTTKNTSGTTSTCASSSSTTGMKYTSLTSEAQAWTIRSGRSSSTTPTSSPLSNKSKYVFTSLYL